MSEDSYYSRLLNPLLSQALAYAHSFLRNRHDAEDAVQHAALRGFEQFDRYDQERPFKGWWFAILRHCCLDMLRARKANPVVSVKDGTVPDGVTAEPSDWEELTDAMDTLSLDHREILRLRYFADLNYEELAGALLIPRGTVMSRLHLARKSLAAKLQEHSN